MDVYTALAGRGATKAVVSFSGGNDEGFCDMIQLLDADDQVVGTLEEYYYGEDERTPGERELVEALCRPVYDQYGSFAGEFHVSGTVAWDVPSRTAKMRDSYGDMSYRTEEREVG